MQLPLPFPLVRLGHRVPYGGALASKYVRGQNGDCWLWVGALNEKGYGRVRWGGLVVPAHRAVYEDLVGPITPGMDLHHVCENPRCVNPSHLQEAKPRHHRHPRRR
jgi:hypothetical protein